MERYYEVNLGPEVQPKYTDIGASESVNTDSDDQNREEIVHYNNSLIKNSHINNSKDFPDTFYLENDHDDDDDDEDSYSDDS